MQFRVQSLTTKTVSLPIQRKFSSSTGGEVGERRIPLCDGQWGQATSVVVARSPQRIGSFISCALL